jgi:hypothetical protein
MMVEETGTNQIGERKYLETIYWGVVLVWAGLVFIADSLGILPQTDHGDAWSWVFLGAGLIALVAALWRATSPDWPSPTIWDYVWAGALLILGLAGFLNVQIAWPMILLLVGVALLGTAFLRRD